MGEKMLSESTTDEINTHRSNTATPKTQRIGLNEKNYRVGESHVHAVLTWDDVDLIRDLREDYGLTYRELAEKFEVSIWTIRDVVKYITWIEKPIRTIAKR